MSAGVFLIATTPGAEKVVVPAAFGAGMGLVLWGATNSGSAGETPSTIDGLQGRCLPPGVR